MISGRPFKLRPRRARSLGRAERNETRDKIRSTSPKGLRAWRIPSNAMDSCRAVMANCRSPIRSSSAKGWCNQLAKRRAPIGLVVVSKTDIKVPSLPPRRLMVSSRSCRALGSSCKKSFRLMRVSCATCLTSSRSRSMAYCNKAPAAQTPGCVDWNPKPDRSLVPKCLVSRLVAVCESKCQAGVCCTGRCSNPSVPSGNSNSAGLSLANSEAN